MKEKHYLTQSPTRQSRYGDGASLPVEDAVYGEADEPQSTQRKKRIISRRVAETAEVKQLKIKLCDPCVSSE
jgi:hypothetical protein